MTEVRNFTVVERTSEPDPDPHGNVAYFLKLEGVEKGVLLRHKKDKPVKNAGDVVEGYYLEEKTSVAGNKYFKLTRPQQQGSNGGGRGPRYTAEDIARMDAVGRVKGRCHAQAQGLSYAALQASRGKLPDDFKLADLKPIIDWFVADAESAR